MNHQGRNQRHHRLRFRVKGTAARPRVSVFRSTRTISLQFIDDEASRTIVAVTGQLKAGQAKLAQAQVVGKEAAAAAKAAGIDRVVFDRSGYRYHGRVKAAADALREGGLSF